MEYNHQLYNKCKKRLETDILIWNNVVYNVKQRHQCIFNILAFSCESEIQFNAFNMVFCQCGLGRIYWSIFNGKFKNTFDCVQKYILVIYSNKISKGGDLYFYSRLPINLKLSSLINANDLVDYILCMYLLCSFGNQLLMNLIKKRNYSISWFAF